MYYRVKFIRQTGVFVLLFVLHVFAQEQKDIAVTVYNNDLGVIKDTRTYNLPQGLSDIRIDNVAQKIDPTSVKMKFNGEVIEQNYQYDLVSLNKILDKYIDKDIRLVTDKGELIEGTLLSVHGLQIVIKRKDFGLIMLPDVSKYRLSVGALPEGLITSPTLLCRVNSASTGRNDVELTYETAGMSWEAEYTATIAQDETSIDVSAWVSIQNNSGVTFRDAKLKLVAGNIHRVPIFLPPVIKYDEQEVDTTIEYCVAEEVPAQLIETPLFEYHSYSLQRTATLANNETKQISLFERTNIPVIKRYIYNADDSNWKKAEVHIEFENSESNNLGIPLPKGKVNIFRPSENTTEFVGTDKLNHIPKDEKVLLKIGNTFDITGSEILADPRNVSKNVIEWTDTLILKNKTPQNVTVEVRKKLLNQVAVLQTTTDYQKVDANTFMFYEIIPANGEKREVFRFRHTLKP
jgi:hypothetical protein